ncbi:M23 family metallopeptidase [Streptomyces qinglanensis]|uniref:Murein DD-endopeptidase MepM and murein hydrolase activator NlpD, contain LysM domain n=1 Tax=Streptomyces qinglanensis TaxID=943816 RepID=A0A1H9Q934_9ACTN|nr:M23 family metallopeptidase [Streptomyces qinglanensis]SER56964.1 Murein DD-endopeptidase MepM and murein hydrolase activator NlpD, contain LysM domain [Streptomyces qinglanensis]
MASRSQGFVGHASQADAYAPPADHAGPAAPYGQAASQGPVPGRPGRSTYAVSAVSAGPGPVPPRHDGRDTGDTPAVRPTDAADDESWEDWNPSEDSAIPVRGRHRVAKQRAGGVARGGTVLGVGMIAAVGAGGMATAQDRDPGTISVPDVDTAADALRSISDRLPDAEDLPGIGSLVSENAEGTTDSGSAGNTSAGPLSQAGLSDEDGAAGRTDAGEALRARILEQAERHRSAADEAAREKAARQAASAAAAEAAERAAAAEEAKEEAKQERAREEAAEQERKAEAERKRKAEAARRAELARSYTAPLASFQLSAGFGQAGGMWQSDHTGQDFAAPNGTPVKAVHSGTVKEAGWAGSYGYRVVLRLEDGTELWFCHLSSMTRSAGDKVGTGDVIGRVGSTGNSTGPHLHVEVRPHGGDPVDPLPWLRDKGVKV